MEGNCIKEFDADLHLHGTYSAGVSKNMLIPVTAEQAKLKGLGLLCTGDILNGQWLDHVKGHIEEESNGIFVEPGTRVPFVLGTEVECSRHVHHLVYLPDFAAADMLKKSMAGTAVFDSWGCGRPRIRLSPGEIAERVLDAGGIIGPAHAFTPYFSIYAHSKSVQNCYGNMAKEIRFMELGLSADSYFADLIPDNHNYQFCTFSDAHSPWPHRIGREFTRMRMRAPGFRELKRVLCGKEPGITLNAGLDPREGKYHRTACNSCYAQYALGDAERFGWRCPKCRGAIKKGVRDLILELAESEQERHPAFRPPYLHTLPLAEIIQAAKGVETINSKAVQSTWRDFVDRFGSEIGVLVDAPVDELADVDAAVAQNIAAFRQGLVLYIPGGGGQYGKPVICMSREEFRKKGKELEGEIAGRGGISGQKTLGEF